MKSAWKSNELNVEFPDITPLRNIIKFHSVNLEVMLSCDLVMFSFNLVVDLQQLFSQKLKTTNRYFLLKAGEVIELRQPSCKASIDGRSSFMVLAIDFGPNRPSLLIFETTLSRNTVLYTSCSLILMLYAQLLSQNIPRSLILYSIPRTLVPLTIYPHASSVLFPFEKCFSFCQASTDCRFNCIKKFSSLIQSRISVKRE